MPWSLSLSIDAELSVVSSAQQLINAVTGEDECFSLISSCTDCSPSYVDASWLTRTWKGDWIGVFMVAGIVEHHRPRLHVTSAQRVWRARFNFRSSSPDIIRSLSEDKAAWIGEVTSSVCTLSPGDGDAPNFLSDTRMPDTPHSTSSLPLESETAAAVSKWREIARVSPRKPLLKVSHAFGRDESAATSIASDLESLFS